MKATKKLLPAVLTAGVILGTACICFGCGSVDDENTDPTSSTAQTTVAETEDYYEMSDEKKASLATKASQMNKDPDNFYGTWVATAGEAIDLYGNMEIEIRKDGTFYAEVTDEKFSGTWKKIDGGIAYKSQLMNGKIYYGKTCEMEIEDSGVSVIIEKKKD